MQHRLNRIGIAFAAGLALIGLASCGSPYLTGAAAASGTSNSGVVDTKFTASMIFDCMRSPNTQAMTFTASGLNAPYDDSASSKFVEITELASVSGSYMDLAITTVSATDDTISVAALVLRNPDGTAIRTISVNGTINYLGSGGFIYISNNYNYGYFFSSAVHAYGDSVTYPYVTLLATKKSQLNW
jgi:hypothetical protein